jgi:hypothetical protein
MRCEVVDGSGICEQPSNQSMKTVNLLSNVLRSAGPNQENFRSIR